MAQATVERDARSYNAVIRACETGREWQLASALPSTMAEAKVESNIISYSAVISACERRATSIGRAQQGEESNDPPGLSGITAWGIDLGPTSYPDL